jgi:hypothetical protein
VRTSIRLEAPLTDASGTLRVSDAYVRFLVQRANLKMARNEHKIARFFAALKQRHIIEGAPLGIASSMPSCAMMSSSSSASGSSSSAASASTTSASIQVCMILTFYNPTSAP